jgi:hypothetical protein
MDRHGPRARELQHRDVVFLQRVPYVHHDDHATQRLSRAEVRIDQHAPVTAHLAGDGRISVAGQIDEPAARLQLEEVDQSSGAGALAGLRQSLAVSDRVDGRDLPAFERPATATSSPASATNCSRRFALVMNRTLG